jgi:hypothetical protein
MAWRSWMLLGAAVQLLVAADLADRAAKPG